MEWLASKLLRASLFLTDYTYYIILEVSRKKMKTGKKLREKRLKEAIRKIHIIYIHTHTHTYMYKERKGSYVNSVDIPRYNNRERERTCSDFFVTAFHRKIIFQTGTRNGFKP